MYHRLADLAGIVPDARSRWWKTEMSRRLDRDRSVDRSSIVVEAVIGELTRLGLR